MSSLVSAHLFSASAFGTARSSSTPQKAGWAGKEREDTLPSIAPYNRGASAGGLAEKQMGSFIIWRCGSYRILADISCAGGMSSNHVQYSPLTLDSSMLLLR